jgi:TPR repeat protein
MNRSSAPAFALARSCARSFAYALAFVVCASAGLGCKDKGRIDMGQANEQPAPPSTMTIANMFGVCDDVAQCERECDAGQADRCRRLGATYQFAQGAAKDEKKATAYYELACSENNAPACVSSGQMYEFSHGVAKDDAKAAGYYKKGCDLGYMVGCANYAIMLENGRGVPKDIPQATTIYANACKAGAGLACDRLRWLTGDGGLVLPDGGGAASSPPPAPSK